MVNCCLTPRKPSTRGGRALGVAGVQLWQRCAYSFTPTVFSLMCGLGIALGLSPPLGLTRREPWLETSVSVKILWRPGPQSLCFLAGWNRTCPGGAVCRICAPHLLKGQELGQGVRERFPPARRRLLWPEVLGEAQPPPLRGR